MAQRLVFVFLFTVAVFSAISSGASIQHLRPRFLSNTATQMASTVVEYGPERNASGITVFETVQLLGETSSLFQGAILKKGAFFEWDFNWDKPWLGAGSGFFEQTFSIMLWGGFVRADRMTMPALEFTVCHEFGHFLGGEPHQMFPFESEHHWSSTEGQSDWWAASQCLPKLYRARGMSDADIESRIRTAGLDFVRFAQFHYEKNATVSLENEATETPPTTLSLAYPTLQCRLDTVRKGAACAFAANTDKATTLCQRPRCWYVETTKN